MTAGELAARFSHSWPTTTRHLGVLTAAGLIRVERQGRERHYLLDRSHLSSVAGLWLGSLGLSIGDDTPQHHEDPEHPEHPDDPGATP
jgi:DNA-binding transcriptional ArsR family regulator